MNSLNNYILEKLKLNKDIQISKIKVNFKKELSDIIHERLKKSKDLNLTDIDISKLEDNDLVYLFEYEDIRSVDMRGWDLSKQRDIHGMFWMNKNVEEIYVDDWDTSNIESMYGLFNGCENLKVLNVSSWDVSNVEEFNYMFQNCISLPETFNIDDWKPKSGADVLNMFAYDKQLKQPSWWRKI